MAFYTGQSYCQDRVSIGFPNLGLLPVASDVKESMEHWLSEAERRDDILYFSIFLDQELVGQILLHDLNPDAAESLVAYHLFRPQVRGHGIGTHALRLVQSYVQRQTTLK